jgi:curved DNA-binding protein CbpA
VISRERSLLGVTATATIADIEVAYRKLAFKLHSDVGGDPKAFLELKRAYEILTEDF